MTAVQVSRRGLFAGTASATMALALPLASAGAASPDAEIIRLAGLIAKNDVAREALMSPFYDSMESGYPPDVDAALNALSREYDGLREQLSQMPAVTVEGCRAKASVMMTWLCPGGVDSWLSDADERLTISLCRDLLRVQA